MSYLSNPVSKKIVAYLHNLDPAYSVRQVIYEYVLVRRGIRSFWGRQCTLFLSREFSEDRRKISKLPF